MKDKKYWQQLEKFKEDIAKSLKKINIRLFKKSNSEDSDDEWDEETQTDRDDLTEVFEESTELDLSVEQKEKQKNRNIRISLGIIAVLILSSDYWLDPWLFPKVPEPKTIAQKKVLKKDKQPVVADDIVKEKKTDIQEIEKQLEDEVIISDSKDVKDDVVIEEPVKELEIPPETPATILSANDETLLNEQELSERLGENPDTSQASAAEKVISQEEKEQVEPPNYNLLGRGLVYNCDEKFWACVSKVSYFQCGGHEQWSQKFSKNPKCVTRNVYASIEDCEIVQAYYVDHNEAVDFCTKKESL